jgi:hypothetical protein
MLVTLMDILLLPTMHGSCIELTAPILRSTTLGTLFG